MNFIIAELRLGLVEFNSTFILNIVNAIVMFLIMKHFLFKPVKKMFKSREDEIKKQYSDAQQAEDNALANKELYESKLADVDSEGANLLKEYKKRAEIQADDIVKNAKLEADKIKQKGQRELDSEVKKTVMELKTQLSEITVMAASKVIGKELDMKDHSQIMDDAISKVGDVKWQS